MKDDLGPWYAQTWPSKDGERAQVVIQSDDFSHDVALIVTGDFSSFNERICYAQRLAMRMNSMEGTREPNLMKTTKQEKK